MELKFRPLKANEIECRVQQTTEKSVTLLLYKDARCDMRLLDEVVGAMNWQRKHEVVNGQLFCTVSVWDADKEQWISKQDVGTESNTEAEKGRASDSFKRACFNLGIGRELYTAPVIRLFTKDGGVTVEQRNNKWTTYDKFSVEHIEVEDGEIKKISIRNDSKKKSAVFVWPYEYEKAKPSTSVQRPVQSAKPTTGKKQPDASGKIAEMWDVAGVMGFEDTVIIAAIENRYHKKPDELTYDEADEIIRKLGGKNG